MCMVGKATSKVRAAAIKLESVSVTQKRLRPTEVVEEINVYVMSHSNPFCMQSKTSIIKGDELSLTEGLVELLHHVQKCIRLLNFIVTIRLRN